MTTQLDFRITEQIAPNPAITGWEWTRGLFLLNTPFKHTAHFHCVDCSLVIINSCLRCCEHCYA